MKKSTVFLIIVVSFVWSIFSLRAAQSSGFIYTRAPAGSIVTSPVNLRFQGVFGLDFCTNPDAVAYRVEIASTDSQIAHYNIERPHTQGEVVDDTLVFNLPVDHYMYVALNCLAANFPNPTLSTTNLEYNGFGATVFEVVSGLAISTVNLADGLTGNIYSQFLQATGGTAPYSWTILSGSLPSNLSLNSSTGAISGTPTTVQTANFTVQVTDANNNVATKDLSITIQGNTPTGTTISVGPLNGVSLIFPEVTQAGQTTVTTSGTGQPPPTGFKLGTPPTYYNISTTAVFTPPVQVCISWTPGQFNNENNLKLWHSDGNTWTDVTTSLDTVTNLICGLTNSFSDFAIFEKKQITATIDIKPNTSPNTINLGSSGTVPVAIFSTPDFDATTLIPTTVTLASAPVKLKGNGTSLSSTQDVNTDGFQDLIVHISTEALQLNSNDTLANLIGYTSDSTEVIGSDTVRIVE